MYEKLQAAKRWRDDACDSEGMKGIFPGSFGKKGLLKKNNLKFLHQEQIILEIPSSVFRLGYDNKKRMPLGPRFFFRVLPKCKSVQVIYQREVVLVIRKVQVYINILRLPFAEEMAKAIAMSLEQ